MLTCWSRFVPLLTNLCGVFGGTITTWPGSTVMVSSPTVNVHVPAWHMNVSSYGCRCRSGPSPGAWRLMKKDMLAPWSLPSNFLARSLPGMSSNGMGWGRMFAQVNHGEFGGRARRGAYRPHSHKRLLILRLRLEVTVAFKRCRQEGGAPTRRLG